jgi:cyclohexadieny/prephenate dehydrogenase
MFDRICILGPGLLGASIAIAAKQRKLAASVSTWSRRAETRAKCRTQNWCDVVADSPTEAVAGAGLVVICTPVSTIAPILETIAPAIAPDTLITDVGSTKAVICEAAAKIALTHGYFIGSHPMAGSDQTGMENARGDLFEEAVCFTTPNEDSPASAHQRLREFWQALGMRMHTTSAQEHDAIVARISHLPHLLASTLCTHLAKSHPDWALFSGTGLRDTTRIAGGDPILWRDIFLQNAPAVLQALNDFETSLQQARKAIAEADEESLFAFLEAGQNFRRKLDTATSHPSSKQ